MKCAACHHEMIKKKGEIDLRIEGVLYLARNISYEECPSCGEKALTPNTSKSLFKKIKNRDFVEEMLNIPVLDGTYG